MAYQPKSYRKFIATAATATMVAGAVAPLATFAAETSFKDATGIYKTPVEYLVEKGFVNGVSKDEFGVSAKVKRGDAAVILSKALGLYATQAPDAGFTDLAAKYKDAVNPLKAAGIISGKTATEFKPDDFLTRGEVAIILAKAYKLEAKNEEALPFTDVNKNYAPFVKALVDNKVANGTTATTFGTASDITRGQMAIFLYNAINVDTTDKVAPVIKLTGDAAVSVDFGAEYKDAGATATDNVDKTVDVKWEIKDAAGKVVDKIDTKVAGKYTITYTAKDAAGNEAKPVTREVTVKEDPAAKVESVSAINAKSLKVTFNKAVDTTKVKYEVKKGSVVSNVSATSWNADKTELTLELAGKLTAGEYTVNITGLTDAALTKSVTVENEKVAEVKLLSDKAVLNTGKTQVTVGYQVLNQYGEDITSSYTVNPTAAGATVSTSGTVTATRGVVTVPVVTASVKEGDAVVVTLVHVGTGKSVSKTVTVSAASAVSDIQITGIYNKDGKTLNETTNLTRDAFYLVVEGKDQYGNAVDASALDALLKNNTNSAIVGLGSSFETVKINGKDATVLRLTGNPTAGSTNVMLISATTGKNASYTVNVAEAQRADSISFQAPELAVAGETLFVPVTVLDKAGNAITDLDVLNDAVRGVKIGGVTGVLTKNSKGVIGYNYTATVGNTTEGYVTLVGLSATNKSTVQNIKVEAAAKPTVVRGLAAGESPVLLANKSLTKASLVVEDQYGRAMTATGGTALTLAADGTATSGYRIAVKDSASNTVIGNGGTTSYIYNATGTSLVKGTNGSEKVEFTIEEYKNGAWTAVAGSAKDVEFRVTDGTEYASYDVEKVGTIFDEVGASKAQNLDYSKELVVYGVLDDGKQVQLDPSAYTVTAPSYLRYSAVNNTFDVNTGAGGVAVPYATDATEAKANVTVTINATGKQFTQEVVVSKVKPKVVNFKVVAEGTTLPTSEAAFDRLTEVTSIPATGNAFFTSTAVNSVVDFIAVDSYGVISSVATGAEGTLSEFKLVGTPAVAYSATLTNQNAYNLAVAGLEKDEVVTVNTMVDGLTKSFKIAGTVDTVADIAAAKTKIEAPTTFAPVAQASVNTAAAAKTSVEGTLATLTVGGSTLSAQGISYEVVDATFAPAIAGTGAPGTAGTNGSYKFKVNLTKGSTVVKTVELTLTVTATTA